jgi:hypothetical protein
MGGQQAVRMDTEAYLVWEGDQATKHEYFHGDVFAMVGASDRHVTIAGNVFVALREHPHGPSESITLQSVGLSVSGERIFEDAPPGPSSNEPA